jgi:hypothetical protein
MENFLQKPCKFVRIVFGFTGFFAFWFGTFVRSNPKRLTHREAGAQSHGSVKQEQTARLPKGLFLRQFFVND